MNVGNFKAVLKNDLFLLLLILFLGFSYIVIENNMNSASVLNVDEWLWVERSQNFLDSMSRFDFAGAVQTVHPGITVMMLGGAAIGLADHFISGPVYYYSDLAKLYFFAIDAPILISMVGFFFSFYFVLRKMGFNRILSFLSMILISVKLTYVFGSTPVDKFATMSILLSLSFLLVYANGRSVSKKYLILASFFAAFGVLSRLSALILIPFSLLVFLYFSSLNARGRRGAFKDFVLYSICFMIFSIIIFPGFLFDATGSINAIIGAPNNALVSGVNGALVAPVPYHEKLIHYLGFFSVGSFTPLATGLFIFFLIFVLKKFIVKGVYADFSEENLFYKNVFIMLVFSLIYLLSSIYFSALMYYRYIMPAFLIFDIGAAIGFCHIISWSQKKFFPTKSIGATVLGFIVVFYVLQFTQLILIYSYVVQ